MGNPTPSLKALLWIMNALKTLIAVITFALIRDIRSSESIESAPIDY